MRAEWGTASGEANRARIVKVLEEESGGLHVAAIARRVGLAYNTTTHHLKWLKKKRLVRAEKVLGRAADGKSLEVFRLVRGAEVEWNR